ncbi:hypothetical protein [Meiothermus sp. CFH 77666]|uniref:hypothetical protein n=1 Tax=Meiothermus sp. CFH 77666 TaxID=2817942 RepID=UPI001AA01CAD|nr:hypothetical protein [Meiothermus sp. CFH 77666]MBO1436538.1 hypothetical protein [Meiothermus sp. CFH 77666]
MRIEVAVMMQVHVPDNTDLDDLSLEIDESGLRFVSNGKTVADASSIEDYYIDDIESEDDFDEDWDDEDDEDEDDEDDE